jgi:hypothetical protein
MPNAVSYAYANAAEQRPTLMDQFTACREYATECGYTIVGEFNDIDAQDHQASGAAMDAIRDALTRYGATVILAYEPSSAVLDRLNALGAQVERVEQVAARPASSDLQRGA